MKRNPTWARIIDNALYDALLQIFSDAEKNKYWFREAYNQAFADLMPVTDSKKNGFKFKFYFYSYIDVIEGIIQKLLEQKSTLTTNNLTKFLLLEFLDFSSDEIEIKLDGQPAEQIFSELTCNLFANEGNDTQNSKYLRIYKHIAKIFINHCFIFPETESEPNPETLKEFCNDNLALIAKGACKALEQRFNFGKTPVGAIAHFKDTYDNKETDLYYKHSEIIHIPGKRRDEISYNYFYFSQLKGKNQNDDSGDNDSLVDKLLYKKNNQLPSDLIKDYLSRTDLRMELVDSTDGSPLITDRDEQILRLYLQKECLDMEWEDVAAATGRANSNSLRTAFSRTKNKIKNALPRIDVDLLIEYINRIGDEINPNERLLE